MPHTAARPSTSTQPWCNKRNAHFTCADKVTVTVAVTTTTTTRGLYAPSSSFCKQIFGALAAPNWPIYSPVASRGAPL